MRPNRPWIFSEWSGKHASESSGAMEVAGGFFGNDTVWDGMRHGTVIPEVAMGTWQTVEAAALNAGLGRWSAGSTVNRGIARGKVGDVRVAVEVWRIVYMRTGDTVTPLRW